MSEVVNIDFELRARQYRSLKAKIDEVKERQKAELRPLTEAMEDLKLFLLDGLNKINSENIRTEEGTVHKVTRKSASASDREEFMGYVIENRAWDLIDAKPNVTAVADFIDEHGEPPPGVNFNVHVDASVLAPKAKG